MNKRLLVDKIVALLDAELLRFAQAARSAQAGATDEQSRAENKYDTRGLEASYLAHGQSRLALETAQAREQIVAMKVHAFASDEPIALGALVEVESDGECLWHFLAPAAGGTEISCEQKEILVLTAQSPLGRSLIGRCKGDVIELGAGKSKRVLRLISVE